MTILFEISQILAGILVLDKMEFWNLINMNRGVS